jgi:N-alpha-acetyltransferase 50
MSQATLFSYFSEGPHPGSASSTQPTSENTACLSSNRPLERILDRTAEHQQRPSNPIPPTIQKQSRPPLPPSIQITHIRPTHIDALKRLTQTILPIRYPDKFYNELLQTESIAWQFSRVVLHEDQPVGWIRCRLETHPTDETRTQIYIQAFCVLAPWREQGLGAHLLTAILDTNQLAQHRVSSVYAHVWERNEDALEWYQRRGFMKGELVKGYYKRLKPADAWIVRRGISVQDHLPSSTIRNP